jgi:hypothetical protein
VPVWVERGGITLLFLKEKKQKASNGSSFLVRKEAKELSTFPLTTRSKKQLLHFWNPAHFFGLVIITIFIVVNFELFLMYSPDKYFYKENISCEKSRCPF